MSKADLKKYIKDLEPDTLREIILDLYSASKEAKQYLEYSMSPNDIAMRDDIIMLINKEFRPTIRYRRLKFTKCKKAIADFKRFDPNPEMLLDVMTYMVESAVDTAEIWGNVDSSFADSLASNCKAAMRYAEQTNQLEAFKSRFSELVPRIDDFGWGAGIELYDIYRKYYNEDPGID